MIVITLADLNNMSLLVVSDDDLAADESKVVFHVSPELIVYTNCRFLTLVVVWLLRLLLLMLMEFDPCGDFSPEVCIETSISSFDCVCNFTTIASDNGRWKEIRFYCNFRQLNSFALNHLFTFRIMGFVWKYVWTSCICMAVYNTQICSYT